MRQFSYPNSQFTNILGGASIGWKLNVYDTGTTNKASIYSDLGQTVPTANPVIADADGFLASFYWTGTIDVVLTDENDNLIDSAAGIQDLVSTINAVVVAGNISLPYGAASGSGDTITATLPITSDFSDGGMFIVRANAANTGAANTPNLQVNSYASRRIKKIGGVALIANDIVSGMNMILVYDLAQDCYYLINHEATFLKRDGTAKMLAALDMDSHKINNLTAGTSANDAVNYTQLTTYSGNAALEFAVATATTGNSAVNKTQFDAKTGQATETVAGIAEICTDAELLAGTSDTVVATPLKLRLGFAVSIGTRGYVAFPTWLGGVVIQWGKETIATSGTVINFPLATMANCYSVVGTADQAYAGGDIEYVGFTSVSATNFTANTCTFPQIGGTVVPSGGTFWWVAIGK